MSLVRNSQSNGKLIPFSEMRRLQRLEQEGKVGPGTTEYLKPFGAECKKVGFGSKYEFKANRNPGPGQYKTNNAFAMVKSRSSTTLMKGPKKGLQNVNAQTNSGPGTYNPHK